jgi:hypothetical protein
VLSFPRRRESISLSKRMPLSTIEPRIREDSGA